MSDYKPLIYCEIFSSLSVGHSHGSKFVHIDMIQTVDFNFDAEWRRLPKHIFSGKYALVYFKENCEQLRLTHGYVPVVDIGKFITKEPN